MQERRLFAFKTRRRVRRSIRFAKRRSALTIAIVVAVGISAIAFASGIAIGLRLAAPDSTDDHFAHHTDHEHSCDEGEEEDHSDHAAHEGSGGPELPARLINTSLAPDEHMAKADTVAWETFPGRPPVDDARIGSTYGNRIDPFKRRVRFHSGIDFVANKGTGFSPPPAAASASPGKSPDTAISSRSTTATDSSRATVTHRAWSCAKAIGCHHASMSRMSDRPVDRPGRICTSSY